MFCIWPLQDYLDAMVGVCYDGVEGVLYLCLFSVLAACAFTVMLCAIPRAWRQIACRSVCSLLLDLHAWTTSFPPPATITVQHRVVYANAFYGRASPDVCWFLVYARCQATHYIFKVVEVNQVILVTLPFIWSIVFLCVLHFIYTR